MSPSRSTTSSITGRGGVVVGVEGHQLDGLAPAAEVLGDRGRGVGVADGQHDGAAPLLDEAADRGEAMSDVPPSTSTDWTAPSASTHGGIQSSGFVYYVLRCARAVGSAQHTVR